MSESLYRKASLVMNPYGALDGELPSIKPTDGSGDFTFSRDGAGASPATRVNASGLIEKGRENLLTYSNDFGGADWNAVTASITTGQSGYDGSSDASLLTATGSGANIYQLNSTTGVLSFSVYAKAGTAGWVRLRLDNTSSTDVNTWVNLSDGSIGSDNGIATNVDSIGSGWYRITSQVNTTDLNNVRIYPADSDGNNSTSGNIYIQDAQLESGLVATSYIETTTAPVSAGLLGDMPRLDYSGGATCPSLLLEPSRVNIHTNSEYLDAYVKSRSTITSNAATSPEGVSNASKIIPLSTSTGWAGVNAPNYSFTSGQTYTLSVFAKAGEYNYCQVGGSTPAFNGSFATINLTNGVVEHESGITATTEDYGNGWWRIYFTHTAIATASSPIGFLAVYSTAVSSRLATQVGDDVSGIYAWGWSAELGSYPTSYIPTYGTASTRGVDSCEKTGIGSLLNDSEGTFFAEIQAQANESTTKVITIGDGTSSNRVQIFYQAGTNITTNIIAGGSPQVTGFTTAVDQTQNAKVIIRYANNNAKFFLNGVEIASDTSVTTPTGLDRIVFNNGTSGSLFSGFNKQLIYFNTALTDAECIALTTI